MNGLTTLELNVIEILTSGQSAGNSEMTEAQIEGSLTGVVPAGAVSQSLEHLLDLDLVNVIRRQGRVRFPKPAWKISQAAGKTSR